MLFFREINRPHHTPHKTVQPKTPKPRQSQSPSQPIRDEVTPLDRKLHRKVQSHSNAPQYWKKPAHIPTRLEGKCFVEDGDTIKMQGYAIRLAGIDAPELDHPYGKASMWAMRHLCKGQVITAHVSDEMSYKRVVATCYLPDGRDIAAELVKMGLAIDWPRFSGGKYRCFETADAREKMWLAVAKQEGRFRPGM